LVKKKKKKNVVLNRRIPKLAVGRYPKNMCLSTGGTKNKRKLKVRTHPGKSREKRRTDLALWGGQ